MSVAPYFLPEAPAARRSPPRMLAAIAFLLALGALMLGSLLASGDDWARSPQRYKAPSHSGPIDPRC
jgi:hypothetical protein